MNFADANEHWDSANLVLKSCTALRRKTYSGTPSKIWAQSIRSVPLSLRSRPRNRNSAPVFRAVELRNCVFVST